MPDRPCCEGRRHGVRVLIELGSEMYQGILGRIFCIFSLVQKILKINENAEKRIIRISGARLVAQADPCVYSMQLAACLDRLLPAAELVARVELLGA